jgi:hypothetical protein
MTSGNGINSILFKQIDELVDSLEGYNKKLPNSRKKGNYDYLRHFFKDFIKENNARACEVSSEEYLKIQKFANNLFPTKTFWNLCIDGRVLGVYMHGASAGIGSSIKVPGGILREFVRGIDGKLKLKEDSDFAKYLQRAYTTYNLESVVEVFDSHLSCAARLNEEQLKGRDPKDAGLFFDISHKTQMAYAVKQFVEATYGKDKSVHAIQTSFDPHTGYMYMGLEAGEVFEYAAQHGRAFSPEIIERFVREGKVISTEEISQDEKVRVLFEKHAFVLNWKTNYIASAKAFWKAIAAMKDDLSPDIAKRIKKVYPYLGSQNKSHSDELDTRILLLLTSAFSGFLNNMHPISKIVGEDKNGHSYPYGEHDEECIRISEGGHPPYKIPTFTVFSYEEANLPGSIELSASLIRKNRKEGRVVDASGNFSDASTFTEATLPIIVQEVVRDELTADEWRELSKMDWTDLPVKWGLLTDDEFFQYLRNKGIGNFSVGIGINNLRKRMALLYYPYHSIASRLIEQYSVALPVIADKYKFNWIIIPFIKLGYGSEQSISN